MYICSVSLVHLLPGFMEEKDLGKKVTKVECIAKLARDEGGGCMILCGVALQLHTDNGKYTTLTCLADVFPDTEELEALLEQHDKDGGDFINVELPSTIENVEEAEILIETTLIDEVGDESYYPIAMFV